MKMQLAVLLTCFNRKATTLRCLEQLNKQNITASMDVFLCDDGSTDGSLELLKSMDLDSKITLFESPHMGKAFALNKGLQHVKTDYTITVDSDTILHPLAVRNIMNKLLNSSKKTAATAGCIFVKNAKKSFITKLQEWDYTLGIFGVKLYQGNYNSTLVA